MARLPRCDGGRAGRAVILLVAAPIIAAAMTFIVFATIAM
jgi:hypothetical protein